jgi:hypothetical protein
LFVLPFVPLCEPPLPFAPDELFPVPLFVSDELVPEFAPPVPLDPVPPVPCADANDAKLKAMTVPIIYVFIVFPPDFLFCARR